MDYEKAYKEVLEQAKFYYGNCPSESEKKKLEKMFPVLKESEDERIRKNCIHFLELQKAHHADTSEIDDCIAYLERQKEPQPAEWSEEDTEMYINVASSLRGYACGLENEEHKKHIKKGLDWLENRFKSLHPQPKQEWSEEDEKMLIGIVERGNSEIPKGECGLTPNQVAWLETRLKFLRPQPHWKPSEEQMEALMLAIEGKCAPTSYLSRRLEDLYEALANEFHVECKLDK